jgi:hypothetical protein
MASMSMSANILRRPAMLAHIMDEQQVSGRVAGTTLAMVCSACF